MRESYVKVCTYFKEDCFLAPGESLEAPPAGSKSSRTGRVLLKSLDERITLLKLGKDHCLGT